MPQLPDAYWAADPSEWGPGKVHVVNAENPRKMMCGKRLEVIGGHGTTSDPTCASCRNAVLARAEREEHREQWDREQRERDQAQREKRTEWWRWYNAYLLSPKWRSKAAAVMRRADRTCEGCRTATATQIHHLSYAHAGDEFLWELVAVCTACHQRLHERRDAEVA